MVMGKNDLLGSLVLTQPNLYIFQSVENQFIIRISQHEHVFDLWTDFPVLILKSDVLHPSTLSNAS